MQNRDLTGVRAEPQVPGHPRNGFDTTHSLTLAGRLNQLPPPSRLSRARTPLPKPVEPGRKERATRVETTPHPNSQTQPPSPWFRHDQLTKQAGRLGHLREDGSRDSAVLKNFREQNFLVRRWLKLVHGTSTSAHHGAAGRRVGLVAFGHRASAAGRPVDRLGLGRAAHRRGGRG